MQMKKNLADKDISKKKLSEKEHPQIEGALDSYLKYFEKFSLSFFSSA